MDKISMGRNNVMDLKSFIEERRIDWADAYFSPDCGTSFYSPFQLQPGNFITFAKADFFNADARGLVNALSNSKRAIDCQIDSCISAIGLNPEKLDKQLGPHGLSSLPPSNSETNATLKLRFLQALGIATPEIVSRMRRLRNLLEHEYRHPRKSDVRDAIGVAELFVQACSGKMKTVMGGFTFGSGLIKTEFSEDIAKGFYVSFKTRQALEIEVRFWDRQEINSFPEKRSPSITIEVHDKYFMPLMKLVWHADFDRDMTEPIKSFLKEIGIKFSVSRFRIQEI
jgi:hypothetical protein